MKKKEIKQANAEGDDVRPEYDFKSMKGGVRGKYYKAYRAGHKDSQSRRDNHRPAFQT
jgi:hypothetical protein